MSPQPAHEAFVFAPASLNQLAGRLDLLGGRTTEAVVNFLPSSFGVGAGRIGSSLLFGTPGCALPPSFLYPKFKV